MSAPTTPAASAAPATPTPPPTPAGLLRLFVGVALVGIGGGLPAHTRRALTTRGWMTDAEFAEAYTLAQLTPGPNAVNLAAMIGARLLGGSGAALSVVGILTPGLIAMLTVTAITLGLPGGLPPTVQSGLRGAACAALCAVLHGLKLVTGAGQRGLEAVARDVQLFVAAALDLSDQFLRLLHQRTQTGGKLVTGGVGGGRFGAGVHGGVLRIERNPTGSLDFTVWSHARVVP